MVMFVVSRRRLLLDHSKMYTPLARDHPDESQPRLPRRVYIF